MTATSAGYFRRQVIAATSDHHGAAVRPSSLPGSIPVSVRTILVRKLLAGWEGKMVSLNYTSWNQTIAFIRRIDELRRVA